MTLSQLREFTLVTVHLDSVKALSMHFFFSFEDFAHHTNHRSYFGELLNQASLRLVFVAQICAKHLFPRKDQDRLHIVTRSTVEIVISVSSLPENCANFTISASASQHGIGAT
jgi:hypothetical protein